MTVAAAPSATDPAKASVCTTSSGTRPFPPNVATRPAPRRSEASDPATVATVA
jgi:hypothetical protein